MAILAHLICAVFNLDRDKSRQLVTNFHTNNNHINRHDNVLTKKEFTCGDQIYEKGIHGLSKVPSLTTHTVTPHIKITPKNSGMFSVPFIPLKPFITVCTYVIHSVQRSAIKVIRSHIHQLQHNLKPYTLQIQLNVNP